jgi:hypothetical protein
MDTKWIRTAAAAGMLGGAVLARCRYVDAGAPGIGRLVTIVAFNELGR